RPESRLRSKSGFRSAVRLDTSSSIPRTSHTTRAPGGSHSSGAAERREAMNSVHRPFTLWLLATLAAANVHAVSDADHRPVLVVVLHNYAAIAPQILEQASREVARVYGGLGVEVRWIAPLVELASPNDILTKRWLQPSTSGCSSATRAIAPSTV